jgi:hypothetical protein
MHRILVVANETLEGVHLLEEVSHRIDAAGGPEACAVHLVVPAHHGTGGWSEGGAKAEAQFRLDDAMVAFKELGAEVTGEVGDPSPVLAVTDAMIAQHHDEIVISTLPAGVSKWMKQDAISRIRRNYPSVTVTHVTAGPS